MQLGGKANERLGIKLTVDKALADEFAVEIATILNGQPPLLQGNDDMVVSWVLNIEYLGGVRERLAAIERMLEHPGVVKGVRTEELSVGRSLVQDVFLKLERIERKLSA